MLMIGKGPGMFGGETMQRSGSGSMTDKGNKQPLRSLSSQMTEIDPKGKTVRIKDKKTTETIRKIIFQKKK